MNDIFQQAQSVQTSRSAIATRAVLVKCLDFLKEKTALCAELTELNLGLRLEVARLNGKLEAVQQPPTQVASGMDKIHLLVTSAVRNWWESLQEHIKEELFYDIRSMSDGLPPEVDGRLLGTARVVFQRNLEKHERAMLRNKARELVIKEAESL